MLGPNGAGKTTLISIICGIVNPTSGEVKVDNLDIINDYRETRSKIGLVPQELTLDNYKNSNTKYAHHYDIENLNIENKIQDYLIMYISIINVFDLLELSYIYLCIYI